MKTSTLYHIKNSALKIIPGNEVIACNLPFYCVDWDRYGAKWEHLEQFLINVKKKEERGETRYVYTNKFEV